MTDVPESLLYRLSRHAQAQPKQVAFRDAATGESIDWVTLQSSVVRLSNDLQSRVPAGAIVMVICENRIEFPILFLALMHGGFGALLVTPDSAPAERLDIARRAQVAAVIASDSVLDAFADSTGAAYSLREDTSRRSMGILPMPFGDARTEHGQDAHATNTSRRACFSTPFPTSKGVLKHALPENTTTGRLLLLSSGSTAKPKIVVRSVASVNAVCDQMVRAIGFTPADQVLATVPLCHSYGIEHGLLAPVYAGATTHLCRGLDWPTLLGELSAQHITVLPGVPSMFEMLTELGSGADALPNLRAAYSAGGPLPVAVAQRFEKRFGVAVTQLYGATEIGSVTYADPRLPRFNPASVGLPMLGVQIKIDGQVWVSAPSMLDGYLGVPGSPITDGFYPTGDIGEIDPAGNLCITGRINLLLEIGGKKVNPLEVEEVLRQHPAVADCVVAPVRQSETILRLKAIVTPRDPSAPPQIIDLRKFARQRLASYKVPRLYEVRDSLPRTAAGKIQRHLVD